MTLLSLCLSLCLSLFLSLSLSLSLFLSFSLPFARSVSVSLCLFLSLSLCLSLSLSLSSSLPFSLSLSLSLFRSLSFSRAHARSFSCALSCACFLYHTPSEKALPPFRGFNLGKGETPSNSAKCCWNHVLDLKIERLNHGYRQEVIVGVRHIICQWYDNLLCRLRSQAPPSHGGGRPPFNRVILHLVPE